MNEEENNKSFDLNDMTSIKEKWKPSDGINWDLIQRMRFMNADAEIDPEDSYSKGYKKLKK